MTLNEKLARWTGIVPGVETRTIIGVTTPDGIEHKGGRISNEIYPDFTESLDACFKWLSFSFDTMWIIRNAGEPPKYCWGYARGDILDVICWSKDLPMEECLSPIENHPALALCRAIEKLIDIGEEAYA